MNILTRIVGLISIIFLVIGCNDLIEYSLFETNVISTKININNAELIADRVVLIDTLKFVLMSDSHDYYDKLKDAIKSINQQKGIQFVVCCGDVTARGISQEFIWYRELIADSKYPVFTVIGNHDHRYNGLEIYEKMFGPSNMSFTYMGYKFIIFDDIVWENNNKSPDFDWLQAELSSNDLPCILLAHIPPWGEQLEGVFDLIFSRIITESNIILCMYGHHHVPYIKIFSGVPAIISGSVNERGYRIMKLFNSQYEVENISF